MSDDSTSSLRPTDSTTRLLAAGLVSDGLLHAFGFVAVVTGLFLLADLQRRHALAPASWWALLAGAVRGGWYAAGGREPARTARRAAVNAS